METPSSTTGHFTGTITTEISEAEPGRTVTAIMRRLSLRWPGILFTLDMAVEAGDHRQEHHRRAYHRNGLTHEARGKICYPPLDSEKLG